MIFLIIYTVTIAVFLSGSCYLYNIFYYSNNEKIHNKKIETEKDILSRPKERWHYIKVLENRQLHVRVIEHCSLKPPLS